MCGEKLLILFTFLLVLGSPPHVRGKGVSGSRRRRDRRITPACAGKSYSFFSPSFLSWDHPRMCGEKAPFRYSITCSSGSPPHVRGKVPLFQIGNLMDRITPACAGKSFHDSLLLSEGRDHPRMCGEKSACHADHQRRQGSPPHVRGKAFFMSFMTAAIRITPACAGKSSPRRCSRAGLGDHPRMCGEKSAA